VQGDLAECGLAARHDAPRVEGDGPTRGSLAVTLIAMLITGTRLGTDGGRGLDVTGALCERAS